MRNATAPKAGKTAIPQRMRHRGFTLIEVMVVVLIIAILAGIAYPSYTRYVIETRRADGQAGALQLAGRLEKFFTQCGTYDVDIVTAAGTFNGCTGLELSTANSPDGNYTMTIVAGANGIATSYQIRAQPIGPQANDADCLILTLGSDGVKGQTGPNTQNRCWRR